MENIIIEKQLQITIDYQHSIGIFCTSSYQNCYAYLFIHVCNILSKSEYFISSISQGAAAHVENVLFKPYVDATTENKKNVVSVNQRCPKGEVDLKIQHRRFPLTTYNYVPLDDENSQSSNLKQGQGSNVRFQNKQRNMVVSFVSFSV